MRSLSLLGLLLFVTSTACGSSVALDIPSNPPAEHRELVSIKVEQAALAKDALNGVKLPEIAEFLRGGRVTVAAPREFRTLFAASVASGRASVFNSITWTALAGVPVRFRQAMPNAMPKDVPVLSGSVLSRLTDGQFAVKLDLNYGSETNRVLTEPAIRETLSVADGGMILVRLPNSEHPQWDNLLLLTVSRVPAQSRKPSSRPR